MHAAAKLGISITISPVGSDLPTSGIPAAVSPVDRTQEWQPTFALDEESSLHQLLASLVQILDASIRKLLLNNYYHWYCINYYCSYCYLLHDWLVLVVEFC